MTLNRYTSATRALALLAVAWLMTTAPGKSAMAAESEPVGYGGAKIQLSPIMAPYRTSTGVRYQVVTVRLVLDVGVNERPACFMIPVVHEKFLLYFTKALLGPADLAGQRKDVVAKTLLDLATATTDRGFYSGVEIVDDSMLARGDDKATTLDPKSQTLSVQCR